MNSGLERSSTDLLRELKLLGGTTFEATAGRILNYDQKVCKLFLGNDVT